MQQKLYYVYQCTISCMQCVAWLILCILYAVMKSWSAHHSCYIIVDNIIEASQNYIYSYSQIHACNAPLNMHVWLAGYHGNGYHGNGYHGAAYSVFVSVAVVLSAIVCQGAVAIPLDVHTVAILYMLPLACTAGVSLLPLTHAYQLLHLHQNGWSLLQ